MQNQVHKTTEHANADGLSRLPLQTAPVSEVSTEAACFNIGQIEALPISTTKLGMASRQDSVISRATGSVTRALTILPQKE